MIRLCKSNNGRGISPAFFLVLLPAIFLFGCAIFDFSGDRENLLKKMQNENWIQEFIDTGHFSIFSSYRIGNKKSSELTVYIEGDGEAWLDRSTVSPNPTPDRPVALRLALQDKAANILYLARACQYLSKSQHQNCHPRYWTTHRFAQEIVESQNAAINFIKRKFNIRTIELIGFSGGGGVAALMAAERSDVVRLVTVAANLDIDQWTKFLHVSPMTGSLNPSDIADQIAHIEQIHLVGQEDQIVQADIVRSFMKKSGNPINQKMLKITGFTHECCWHLKWNERLRELRGNTPPP